MLKPLPRATLTTQATDTLRRFVLNEGLRAGDQLPSERELSEVLSVSRNIVREALKVLVSEGLVIKRPGRGVFVAEIEQSPLQVDVSVTVDSRGHDIESIRHARAALEIGAVDLMVQHATDEHIQQLINVNCKLGASLQKGRSGVKEDIAFHSTLLVCTQNSILIELTPLLVDYFRLHVYHNPASILSNNVDRVVAEHQIIIDALRARNPSKIRQALADHLHLIP